jgi:hypothetical protein
MILFYMHVNGGDCVGSTDYARQRFMVLHQESQNITHSQSNKLQIPTALALWLI